MDQLGFEQLIEHRDKVFTTLPKDIQIAFDHRLNYNQACDDFFAVTQKGGSNDLEMINNKLGDGNKSSGSFSLSYRHYVNKIVENLETIVQEATNVQPEPEYMKPATGENAVIIESYKQGYMQDEPKLKFASKAFLSDPMARGFDTAQQMDMPKLAQFLSEKGLHMPNLSLKSTIDLFVEGKKKGQLDAIIEMVTNPNNRWDEISYNIINQILNNFKKMPAQTAVDPKYPSNIESKLPSKDFFQTHFDKTEKNKFLKAWQNTRNSDDKNGSGYASIEKITQRSKVLEEWLPQILDAYLTSPLRKAFLDVAKESPQLAKKVVEDFSPPSMTTLNH
jgi:hypothetical protein